MEYKTGFCKSKKIRESKKNPCGMHGVYGGCSVGQLRVFARDNLFPEIFLSVFLQSCLEQPLGELCFSVSSEQ